MGRSNHHGKRLSPLVTTTQYPWKRLELDLEAGRQEAHGALPPSQPCLPTRRCSLPSLQFCSRMDRDRRQPTRGPVPGPSPALPRLCPVRSCLALGCSAERTHAVLDPPQNLASFPPRPPHSISPGGPHRPRPTSPLRGKERALARSQASLQTFAQDLGPSASPVYK